MSPYECSCGATFDLLSRYRLHQRDECPDRGPEIDVADEDLEEIVDKAVEELLVCDVCGRSNDGAEGYTSETTDAGLSIELHFECEYCGAWNDNTAILSGGSA